MRVIVSGDDPLTDAERAKLDRVRSLIAEIGNANLTVALPTRSLQTPALAAIPVDVLDRSAIPVTPGRSVLCRCGLEIDIGNVWAVVRHRQRCLFGLMPVAPGSELCGSTIPAHPKAIYRDRALCTRQVGHERDARELLHACMDGRLVARQSRQTPRTWAFCTAVPARDAPRWQGGM